jgi:hypothetical protein
MDNPMAGGKKEMPPVFKKQFEREALGNAALLDPEKYGISYQDGGKKKVDGKECILLERIFPDGKKSITFLDAKTHLPVRVKTTTLDQMGKTVGSESIIGDYKEVNGVMTAHRIISFREGKEFAIMKFTEIQHNTGLKDSIFQMDPK